MEDNKMGASIKYAQRPPAGAKETLGQGVRRLIMEKSAADNILGVYSDADIAGMAGISPAAMSRIVNDSPNYEPRVDTIRKLANVLGPQVFQLFLGMYPELVEMWQHQDTPAGKAALNQAHETWKRA